MYQFPQKYFAAELFSMLIIIRNVYSAANQDIHNYILQYIQIEKTYFKDSTCSQIYTDSICLSECQWHKSKPIIILQYYYCYCVMECSFKRFFRWERLYLRQSFGDLPLALM